MQNKDVINQIISKILEVIKPDKIILFGSQARGTADSDSDYDVLIIKNEIPDYFNSLKQIYRKMLEIDARVDIVLKSSEDVEKSKQKIVSITKEALKEGIVIYE